MRLSPVPIGIGMGVCGGHCYRELRGIRLPRTRVNKGMKEGRSAWRRPRCSRRRRTRRSDTEELLLLGFEILVGDDALIPELGEPFEFAYVLGFVRSRGGSNGRSFGRFLAATKVFLRPNPALNERATPLHARHGPVGLPRLHPLCASIRHESHLRSPSSLCWSALLDPTYHLRPGAHLLRLAFLESL